MFAISGDRNVIKKEADIFYNIKTLLYSNRVHVIIFSGPAAQRGLWPPRIKRFLDHTQLRATVDRSPLDE
jgi:hypothetical protein